MSNNLLFDSPPIVIPRKLAELVGINEAAVLQQIHYWCNVNEKAKRNYRDGNYWVYNSISKWLEEFPWLSRSTLERVFAKLKKENLIIVAHYSQNSFNRTNWYRINYDTLNALDRTRLPQNEVIKAPILTGTITENNAENNGKKEKGNLSGYPSDNPTNPLSVSIPIVEPPNEEISSFIDWYFALYMEYYGCPHPNIKSQQRIRITETLSTFMDANCLDVECLQEMAYAFFDNVEYTDHNINHFATYGILENRYYEAIY